MDHGRPLSAHTWWRDVVGEFCRKGELARRDGHMLWVWSNASPRDIRAARPRRTKCGTYADSGQEPHGAGDVAQDAASLLFLSQSSREKVIKRLMSQ